MTLNPKCESVETAKGVAVTVTGVRHFVADIGRTSSCYSWYANC